MSEDLRLTSELLESVLDPSKYVSDTVDAIQTTATITKEFREREPAGYRVLYPGQWMGWLEIIDESPLLQKVIDDVSDHLRPTPEQVKREDLPTVEEYLGRLDPSLPDTAREQPPEF